MLLFTLMTSCKTLTFDVECSKIMVQYYILFFERRRFDNGKQ